MPDRTRACPTTVPDHALSKHRTERPIGPTVGRLMTSMPARMSRGPLVANPLMRPALAALIEQAKHLEGLSMAIYVRLAVRFGDKTELARFWMSMARHEAGHIGALELLSAILDQAGSELQTPARAAAVDEFTAVVERLHQRADEDISVEESFEIVLELESSEFNDLVIDLISGLADDTQRRQTQQMLLHDLSDLSLMIEKYTQSDDLLAQADTLVEKRVGLV